MKMSIVEASDGLFGLLDEGEIPAHTADWSNGLVAMMSAGALIATGVNIGPVRVQTATSTEPAAPPVAGQAEWDEIIEVTVHAPRGRLRVEGLEHGTVGDLPVLSAQGSGSYRLRVHARGRAIAPDQAEDDPVEDYLLQVWPAGAEEGTVVLRSSERIERALQNPPPAVDGPDPYETASRSKTERDQLLRDQLLRGGGTPDE